MIYFRCLLFVILTGSALADPSSPAIESVRPMIRVATDERNPFAKRAPMDKAPTAVESEESRIRAALSRMTVVGRTHGPRGWKVLLGDLILEDGKQLPSVITGQTEVLISRKISENEIEVIWVSENATAEPRKMLLPIHLTPVISTVIRAPSPPGVAAADAPPF